MRDGKGRSATKDNNEDDDLHVVISGDSEEALDHAEALVRRLLVPVEEGKNDIKRKQLRKLAELNGTLKDNNYGFEREQREGRNGGGPSIQCRWCGETSHPSSDCTLRGNIQGGPPTSAASAAGPKLVTKEYYDLMVSVGEDVSGMAVIGNNDNNPASSSSNTGEKEEGFSAFLASVGVVDSSPAPPRGPNNGHHGGNNGHHGHHGGPGHNGGYRNPSSNDFHGQGRYGGGGNNFHPSQPNPPPNDDIPPWEREEALRGNGNPPPNNSFSADAPAPWDM